MVLDKTSVDQGMKRVNGSIRSIFMHADGMDMWLMALGFLGAVFDGLSDRLVLLFTSHMINSIGSASKLDNDVLKHNLDKVYISLSFPLLSLLIFCFLFFFFPLK